LEGKVNFFVNNEETSIRIHFENISLRDRIIETLKKKKKDIENIVDRKDEFTLRFVVKENGQTGCKFVSDGYSAITGLDPDAVIENGVKEAVHADDLRDIEEALEEAFEGKSTSVNCRYKTENGNYINVIQSFKPDYGANGTVVESVKSVAMIELEVEK